MLMKLVNAVLIGTSRYILWFSKEKTETIVIVVGIITTKIRHNLSFRFRKFASLVVFDQRVPVPLPNRWTNDDKVKSQQRSYMGEMQKSYLSRSSKEMANKIGDSDDMSWANINLTNTLFLIKRGDYDSILRIRSLFNPKVDKLYSFERELMLAESVVNGQNPYVLRKFNSNSKITYDFEESKGIEEQYRKCIKSAFQKETLNQQALDIVGISSQQIQKAISSGDNVYSMFYEHLEKLLKGQPTQNRPEIFLQNETLRDKYVLQSPYALFLKAKKGDSEGFICVGVAFRYNHGKDVTVFSPFFSKQPYKCWKLARSHLFQASYNDFHIRVHLGVMHLTMNQYNVPIYNSLRRMDSSTRQAQNLKHFIEFAYTMFNEGLEGVNVKGLNTLLNPIHPISNINKVFNFNQEHAYGLIATYANQLDLLQFNPERLLAKSGLTRNDGSIFDQVQLDARLAKILADYITDVYQIYQIDKISKPVLEEIQKETKNMTMGKSKLVRSAPQNGKELLKYIQNMAFTWVSFHAHTFTVASYGSYYAFRPSMLRKEIPSSQAQWEKIEQGTELPHPKVIIQTSQLLAAVCAKDPNNYIIDKFKQYLFQRSYAAMTTDNEVDRKQNQQMQTALNKAIKQLNDFGTKVDQVNTRRVKNNQPPLIWMNPTFMQGSINI